MNFNKIILPDFMFADLYKGNLVLADNDIKTAVSPIAGQETEAPGDTAPVGKKNTKSPATQASKPLSYLGSNNKHISIIVSDNDAIHLQDELLEILSAILSACKLNLADVAIINAATQPVTDKVLRQELSPRVVLLFGIETSAVDLPFSIPMYKTQSFNNCTYLQAASLEIMRGSTNEAKVQKSKLWVCLKTIFAI
jgi:hypothetical protein